MSKYIRPATMADVAVLASQLREADVSELRAASGHTPEVALPRAIKLSDPCNVMLGEQGELVGIYGVVPIPFVPSLGAVWMHGTDNLANYPFQFLRRCRRGVLDLHERYPILFNFVDARNTLHIKWLKWMGFHFINYHPTFGAEDKPFYEFVRITNV